MIHYIRGTLAMKLEDCIVIETGGGVGLEISVSANSRLYLSDIGEEVIAYTAMTVREDDISLYGFEDTAGLELFNKLITVNGVGAKAALSILSSVPPAQLKRAIVFEDAEMLTRANGIGKKTAQRIVLDLKDKLGAVSVPDDDGGPALTYDDIAASDEKAEATEALIALGYSRSEAAAALMSMKDDEMTAEEYIKAALKKL